MDRALVVGASLAGLSAARELHRSGEVDVITVIGAEPHRPYDRPPLSKGFLAGTLDEDRLALPGAAALGDAVTWRLGAEAVSLDLAQRRVDLADGSAEHYDGLVIATGARARRLPMGHGLSGQTVLRTLDDARALRAELDATDGPVVVIGAGFIGAEVAATCRELGRSVSLVDALPVPMVRGLGSEIGAILADLHRSHGVDLHLETGVEAIEGQERVERVRLDSGVTLDASVVVVGIGVSPATEWLRSSGLRLDDGVVCDETMLAADGVVAAGDIARWPNRRFGELMRVEHWENAVDQGAAAAKRLLTPADEAIAFEPVPWFWSDQYDRKIQVAGRVRPSDEVQIVSGSVEEWRFAALYGRGDALVGVFGMNRPRQVMAARNFIRDGVGFAEAVESMRDG